MAQLNKVVVVPFRVRVFYTPTKATMSTAMGNIYWGGKYMAAKLGKFKKMEKLGNCCQMAGCPSCQVEARGRHGPCLGLTRLLMTLSGSWRRRRESFYKTCQCLCFPGLHPQPKEFPAPAHVTHCSLSKILPLLLLILHIFCTEGAGVMLLKSVLPPSTLAPKHPRSRCKTSQSDIPCPH